MKISHFLTSGAALAAMAMLGACQQQKAPEPQPSAAAQGQAAAGPEAPAGLSVSDGVLVLPAVKGRPGVAYFAVTNASAQATSLAAVFVEGAGKAEMHETKGGKMEPLGWAQVEAGQTVRFERGGKHVMLFDLADTLKPGGTAEMTLTVSGGDKVSAPLRIEAAGGAM